MRAQVIKLHSGWGCASEKPSFGRRIQGIGRPIEKASGGASALFLLEAGMANSCELIEGRGGMSRDSFPCGNLRTMSDLDSFHFFETVT